MWKAAANLAAAELGGYVGRNYLGPSVSRGYRKYFSGRRKGYRRYGGKRRSRRRTRRRTRTRKRYRKKNRSKTVRRKRQRRKDGVVQFSYRARDSARQLETTHNQVQWAYYPGNNLTGIEQAIDDVPFFDPSNPGTIISASLKTPTFSKDVRFHGVYCMLRAKNNYTSDVKVTMFLVVPRSDTGLTALATATAGWTDVSGGNLTDSSPMITLKDSPNFRRQYKTLKTVRRTLKAGQEMTIAHQTGGFFYNNSFVDTHALENLVSMKSFQFLVRVEGTLAHDTIATQVGRQAAGVDIEKFCRYDFEYDAGFSGNYIKTSDGNDTMTTQAQAAGLDVEKIQYSI